MIPMILVVDDDSAIRALVVRILESEGYNVATANSGEAAISMITAHPPRMLILDVHLPDIDGPTLYAQLQTLPGMDRVPVIWMTAHVGVISGLPYDHPHMAVMTKPFAMDALVNMVSEFVTASV